MNTRQLRARNVWRFVTRYPGSTCLEIADQTATEPALVRVALQDARKAGKVRSEGITRGTRWYCVVRG